MNPKRITQLWLIAMVIIAITATTGYAAIVYGDKGSNWPASWIPITSLNDPDDGKTESADFVGDATNPGGYVAVDNDYVYFRVRVDIDAYSSSTFRDSIFVLIDKVGTTDYSPDYAFTWDAKSNDISKHGLELQALDTVGSTWATTKMLDIDGTPSSKVSPDFAVPPGDDGYVLVIDHQVTTNFGETTFIDLAIQWSFLTAGTTLAPGQSWRIQFGSVTNSTDHNFLTTDVAGGTNPTDSGLDWSSPILMNNPPVEQNGSGGAVPEPATVVGLAIAAIGMAARRTRKRKI